MPAWGLIPDSPAFYWGGKALRASRRSRSRSNYRGSFATELVLGGVDIYRSVFEFEINSPYGVVGRHMNSIGTKIMLSAKAQAGFQTGALKASINMEHRGIPRRGQTLKIGSALPYAYMHHQGTRPHIITPKDSDGTLVFRKNSRIIHTKQVMHPGTKPNRYLSDQLRRHIR